MRSCRCSQEPTAAARWREIALAGIFSFEFGKEFDLEFVESNTKHLKFLLFFMSFSQIDIFSLNCRRTEPFDGIAF